MTNSIEKIKQLETKVDSYKPRKESEFIAKLKHLLKETTFDKEDAVKFIMRTWIKKINVEQGKVTNDCLDDQLSKADKRAMLKEIENIIYFVPGTWHDDVHERVFNIYQKIVKTVDTRFKEDFPTVTYKLENKYELDTKRNAETVRNCIMTEPSVLNKLGDYFDKKRLTEKRVRDVFEELGYKFQFMTKDNGTATIYFTNEKDEEMYDSNVYFMEIYKDSFGLGYKDNIVYEYRNILLDRITRPIEVEYGKVEDIKSVVKSVNKELKRTTRYKIEEDKLEELRKIMKANISEQKRYIKADGILNKIGAIANDIKKTKINIDLLKDTVLKVVDVVFKKNSVEYKVVDSIKLKSERSRKLKADVKYYITNDTAIVYVQKKEDVDYYEVNIVETNVKGNTKKDKEMRTKREKGFRFAVTTDDNKAPVMYFKTKREAIKNIKKYVEKVA